MDRIWEGLPESSTLRACGPDGYRALALRWSEAHHAPRSAILGEQDPGNDVYFILSGRARAAIYSAAGREVTFADLTAGACFGEIAAIDGGHRSANVIAIEATRTARLSAKAFLEVLEGDPGVLRAFLVLLAGRVRTLSTRMHDVTTMNARQRLISELISLAEPAGGAGDAAVIETLPTQQALANAILGQREAVGREMSRLRDAGLISRTGRRLTIPSLDALRDALEGG